MHDPEGQLLEYAQYLPDSLHSLDRGKHLGEHRISQYLWKATATVQDITAERTFVSRHSWAAKEPAGTSPARGWAVVAAGGTVEMYSLTPSEHQEVAKAIVEEVHDQVPVISGTGFDRSIAENDTKSRA
jgi:Dihydrodipicolinate synthetase family